MIYYLLKVLKKKKKKEKYWQNVIEFQKMWYDNKVKISWKKQTVNFFDDNYYENIIKKMKL